MGFLDTIRNMTSSSKKPDAPSPDVKEKRKGRSQAELLPMVQMLGLTDQASDSNSDMKEKRKGRTQEELLPQIQLLGLDNDKEDEEDEKQESEKEDEKEQDQENENELNGAFGSILSSQISGKHLYEKYKKENNLKAKYHGLINFKSNLVDKGTDLDALFAAKQAKSSALVMKEQHDAKGGKSFKENLGTYASEKFNKLKAGASKTFNILKSPFQNKGEIGEGIVDGVESSSEAMDDVGDLYNDGLGTVDSVKEAAEAEDTIRDLLNGEVDTDVGAMDFLSLVGAAFKTVKEPLDFIGGLVKSIGKSIMSGNIKYFSQWAKKKAGVDLIFNENSTTSEKIYQGFETLGGIVSWINDKLGLAKAIVNVVSKASSAVPILGSIIAGIDIVVKGLDIGFQVYKIMKSRDNRKSMESKQRALKSKLFNSNQNSINKYKVQKHSRSTNSSPLIPPKDYTGIEKGDIAVNKEKMIARRLELESNEDSLSEEEKNELYDIRTYMFAENLADVNRKRKNRSLTHIAFDVGDIITDAVAMAGGIVTATGVAAAAGVGLNVASGLMSALSALGKMGQKGVRSIKQTYHNIMGDEKSSDVKKAKRTEDAKQFLKMVKALPPFDPSSNEIVEQYENAEAYVDAMGCYHGTLYSSITLEDAHDYLLERMAARD